MREKIKILLKILIGLILIQGIRIVIEEVIFCLVERTLLNDTIFSALIMAAITFVGIIITKTKDIPLAVFPSKHQSIYVIASVITVALLISTPFITGDKTVSSVSSLIYSVVITPIFEELLFRGYVWNKLEEKFDKGLTTYIITTFLFAIWHLGYMDTVLFRMTYHKASESLAFVMLMKVMTGLFFGIVLGAVRYKSKNCYSSILVHSVMNLFGR
jgi:membrane protease YdiL (CAAX protease family)